MSQIIPIYIPTYINSAEYTPARVLPRLFFYNGMINCESYYIESGSLTTSGVSYEQTAFPYFDNYNVVTGSFPTADSDSLLFTNETSVYGTTPDNSLYTNYWETYISLLYNPKTRLLNCSAIIPLADYFKMELNDVVNFRGNYYHLRAINDYSLKTGECNLQLLGPIINTAFSQVLPTQDCNFAFTASLVTTTTTTTAAPTTTTTSTTTTSTTTTTAASIVTSGLVSWYDCSSLSGSNWNDKSVNGNNAQVSGSLLTNKTSQGYLFDSTNYVVWPATINAIPSGSWTMQFLGYLGITQTFGAVDLWCKESYASGWDTVAAREGNYVYIFRDVAGDDKKMGSADTNGFYLITITVNAATDTTKLYLNGNFVTNGDSGGVNDFNSSSTKRLVFGYNADGDAGPFGQYAGNRVKALLLYNKVLSDAEVLTNYNALSGSAC
jgi:hypothetical protein